MNRHTPVAAENLELLKRQYTAEFPRVWQTHFSTPFTHADILRLLGSSAFTLSWAGHQIWSDIVIPSYAEMPPEHAIESAFRDGGLFLVTHHHADHFDPRVIRCAARTPGVRFLMHADQADRLTEAGVSPGSIVPIRPGECFVLGTLSIEAVATPHINIEDSLGFVITGLEQRVCILSDIREYRSAFAAALPPHDILFFNVWLGRGRALNPDPETVSSATRFIAAAAPRHVLLLHLYELNRAPEDVWTRAHAALLADRLAAEAPSVRITVPDINMDYRLTL